MTKFQALSKIGHVLGTAVYALALHHFVGAGEMVAAFWGWLFFTLAVEGEQLSTAYYEWKRDGGVLGLIHWRETLRQSAADAFFWNGTLGVALYGFIVSL